MRRLANLLLCTMIWGSIAGCPPLTHETATQDPNATPAVAEPNESTVAHDYDYSGSVSGTVANVSSTEGLADPQAARSVPLAARAGFATALPRTLDEAVLTDATGQPFSEMPVNVDGTFAFDGLPLDVAFLLEVDLDGDSDADLAVLILIPPDTDRAGGSLDGVVIDPLSTLALGKVLQVLHANGATGEADGLNLVALVERMREAYESLLLNAGIDAAIVLEQVVGLSWEELATLFDLLIPPSAGSGMRIAESNVELVIGSEVDDIVKAAAVILLEGGFVIADEPDGIDLSFLAELPQVRQASSPEFLQLAGLSTDAGVINPNQAARTESDPVFYFSERTEVDRNFVHPSPDAPPAPHKPMITESMLQRLAVLYLEGKTVSLDELYQLMVDIELGMGMRLAYDSPELQGPGPIEVLLGDGGSAIELDPNDLIAHVEDLGMDTLDPSLMADREPLIRDFMADLLDGAVPPTFEQLLGGMLMDPVPDAAAFADYLYEQRAHLPFSTTGPSTWHVIADGDPFQDPAAAAVTVDALIESDGTVVSVALDPGGDGRYYLGLGPMDPAGVLVELIDVSTGRVLHDASAAPHWLDITDQSVFQPVGTLSFHEYVSEIGQHYPGAPALTVPNPDFNPLLPPDPQTNPPEHDVLVLMTNFSTNAPPLRVDYANGIASYNPAGAHYLRFEVNSDTDGVFTLITQYGQPVEQIPGNPSSVVLIAASDIVGISVVPETFEDVFGIDVPNLGYDPAGAPYYDDINENGTQDSDEPSFSDRYPLADPGDWRSTWVEMHYRRADNNGFPDHTEVDWQSDVPRLIGGVALVPRNFQPRQNAYLFGNPGNAIDLMLAFSPHDFFDGTHALDHPTRLNPFMAIAMIDLAATQILNIDVEIDPDGPGGAPPRDEVVLGHLFVAPVADPFSLVTAGLERLAQVAP